VDFFESVALPEPLVAQLNLADVDPGLVRRFAGWRLDSPLRNDATPGGAAQALLSLAEELLLRGTTPLAFVTVERWLEGASAIPWSSLDPRAITSMLQYLARSPSAPHRPGWFDSSEVGHLVKEVADTNLRAGAAWSLHSNTNLSSLVPGAPPESSCDLLMTRVDGGPVVVNLGDTGQRATDEALRAAGYEVIRIPLAEFQARGGTGWSRLMALLKLQEFGRPPADMTDRLRMFRAVHQLQVATVRALRAGHLPAGGPWRLRVRVPEVIAAYPEAEGLFRMAVSVVSELLLRLSKLWSVEDPTPSSISVDLAHRDDADSVPEFFVRFGPDRAAYHISDAVLPAPPLRAPTTVARLTSHDTLSASDGEWFLRWIYRKTTFREGQWECVQRAIQGLDTLLLLPPGAGKSIAYQLAALLRPGPCIVVDPVASLTDDQIDNLATFGIDRAIGINGRPSTDGSERQLGGLGTGHHKFYFVAAERFQSVAFRKALHALGGGTPVSLIAIDEAHCASDWGHDFRTAYVNLGRTARTCCTPSGQTTPPLVGMTGTAASAVLKDIQRALEIPEADAIKVSAHFDRPELRFRVVRCSPQDKPARVKHLVSELLDRFGHSSGSFFGHGPGTGLVFCPHVGGDHGVQHVADALSDVEGITVAAYSGSPPSAGLQGDWAARTKAVARAFKRSTLQVVASTKALGIGIDSPNIRFTAHYGLPGSVEAFYQEAGRAGHDRQEAECVVILSVRRPDRATHLLDPDTSIQEIAGALESVRPDGADDVTRPLYFHTRAFEGIEAELQAIQPIVEKMNGQDSRGRVALPWADGPSGAGRQATSHRRRQKALHRLVTLGVVQDYTADWTKREFQIVPGSTDADSIGRALRAYGRSYRVGRGERLERDFGEACPTTANARVLQGARTLLEFIYGTIELSRRRALSEMLQAATDALSAPEDPDLLKKRVLLYLQRTEWDSRLERVATGDGLTPEQLRSLLDEVVSSGDAEELRGAAVRQLGSYPDQPAFLMLRAFAEAAVAGPDWARVTGDVSAAVGFGLEKYSLQPAQLSAALTTVVTGLQKRGGDTARFVRCAVEATYLKGDVGQNLCRDLPDDLSVYAISPLMTRLIDHASLHIAPQTARTP
jgi:RecQ family ATP-dependent DNA helicase